MKIMNYTRHEESWQPGLVCSFCDEVIETMLARLCSGGFYSRNPELSHDLILRALLDREAQRTTAAGEGIAFPHARLEHLTQALFAVGTLEEPVLFGDFPVRIVCLILVPASEPPLSLKIMAQLSRLLWDSAVREDVLRAQTPAGLRGLVATRNPSIEKPILAHDIMRPPRFSVKDTDPVSKCSHLMSVNNLHAVPVVNDRQEVLGEITVERLFRYGLPDFFSKLKSVSFIAEFDPFEKYFDDECKILARDMMEANISTVPVDYTIMEIVFDLAIQSRPKLYVADDHGRWIGTIDKGLVLDNVINH